MEPIGLYIHVPFCLSKCPYCDFYSLAADETLMDAYTEAAIRSLRSWGERLHTQADTLYFGGGTPSLLGAQRLTRLIETAAALFGLAGAEITLEANPADDLTDTLQAFAATGGNRLSLGMQTMEPHLLRALGRRHSPADVERTVAAAFYAGIDNLSLDMMLGLEAQTSGDVERTAQACLALGASHVSAYLLKIEPGTPFATRRLNLPDDDAAADLYLTAAESLEACGFLQYEISNFARPGYESRHNQKYWDMQPYLGIGPAAHSFLGGQRFFYPRELKAFLAGTPPEKEATGQETIAENSAEEYLMLRLRLTAGLTEDAYAARFGEPIPAAWRSRAAEIPPALLTSDSRGLRLTREGFLVSNAVLTKLLE